MKPQDPDLLGQAKSLVDRAARSEQRIAAERLDEGDLSAAKASIERAEQLSRISDQLQRIIRDGKRTRDRPTKRTHRPVKGRQDFGRLAAGEKTPQSEFRDPILQAVVAMGGSGRVQDVLDRIEQSIGGRLRPVDKETLPSDSRQPRWRNTAQWARLELVQEGLLRSDSPRGVWEISEAGRAHLRRKGLA